MPLVQFTERHYINDRLYEPGDRAWLGDNVGLTAGMIDLGAEAKAAAPTSAEQKAAMDKVQADRKAVDQAAADEIAMEMATERAKVEAKAAEDKAAVAAEKPAAGAAVYRSDLANQQGAAAANPMPQQQGAVGALPLNPAPPLPPGPTKEA